jgi:hypothetical protein
MTQPVTNGSDDPEINTPKATRYVPAKWVACPNKLVEMMEENVGEKNFRVEVGNHCAFTVAY